VAVRVVAGELGGRRLATPPGHATRPTSELVRAAIFNSLEARGLVAGAVVADLFAGSGALGIEALSRGASRAVFVESDRRAVRTIEANLAALGLTARATVRPVAVERWVPEPADLVLVDPPYGWDGWEPLLGALVTFPQVLVVAESDREVTAEGWAVAGSKRHGGTVVTQLRRKEPTAT
jgi:16S rRNA (guanine966-N2)-methyltransferase